MNIIPARPKHVDTGEVYWVVLEGERMNYPFDAGYSHDNTRGHKIYEGTLSTIHGYVLVQVNHEWNHIYCRFIHCQREYSMVISGTPECDEAQCIAEEWSEQVIKGVYADEKYASENQCQCED